MLKACARRAPPALPAPCDAGHTTRLDTRQRKRHARPPHTRPAQPRTPKPSTFASQLHDELLHSELLTDLRLTQPCTPSPRHTHRRTQHAHYGLDALDPPLTALQPPDQPQQG